MDRWIDESMIVFVWKTRTVFFFSFWVVVLQNQEQQMGAAAIFIFMHACIRMGVGRPRPILTQ